MNTEKKLLETCVELIKLLHKEADSRLPQEVANVVKLHSKLAVGSAWIPIPGADVAAGAANIWSMYIRINSKIGIPAKENIIKTVGAGVATNLTSYIAVSGVASAMKFIPGIGSLTGALVMSASLYAVTLASGFVYLKALTALARRKGPDLNVSDIPGAVSEMLKEKGIIKEFIDSAKKEYKK